MSDTSLTPQAMTAAEPGPNTPPGVDQAGAISATEVKKRWEQGQQSVRRLVQNYKLNAAFVAGDQWLYIERGGQQALKELPRDDDRVRATLNRVLAATRTIMAKLHRRPLIFTVIPTSADDAAVQAAHLAESVLDDTAREHEWEDLRAEADFLAWLGGTAVISTDWDPMAGTPLDEGVSDGDTCEKVSSIAQVAFPSGTLNAEKAPWWIRTVVMPVKEARDLYNLSADPQADATVMITNVDPNRRSVAGGSPNPGDRCVVYTYYERPGPRTPGQVAIVIGMQVVQARPWPFPFSDHLNCAVIRESPIPEHWAGDTVMTAAIPIQVAFNAAWSNLIEHLKLCANARLLVPERSLDIMEQLTDTAGEVVPWDDTTKPPEYLAPPVLPQWVVELPTMLRKELDDILGHQEISRGASPSNIQSGLGLSILSEQADTPLAAMAVAAGRAWGRIGSMGLQLYEANVQGQRQARVDVPGMRSHSMPWRGDDLLGQTTALVPNDSVVPRSRAAQQAFAVRLWELKLTMDPKVVAKLGDFPDQSDLLQALDPDTAKAERENHDLTLGLVCIPAPFDDDAKHIKAHDDFRKSQRYEDMPPDQQKVVDDHVMAHEQQAAEKAQRNASVAATGNAQLMAQPMSGHPPIAPPGPPGAPPPLDTGNPAPSPLDVQGTPPSEPLSAPGQQMIDPSQPAPTPAPQGMMQ